MRVLSFLVSLSLLALTGCGSGKQAAATSAPDPLPPNFHDQAYMSARTDSMLLRSIRRGKGEAAMPRWDRILTEEEMKAVLGFVRKFAKRS